MSRVALSIVLVATTLALGACAPDVSQVFDTTGQTGATGGAGGTSSTTTTDPQGGGGAGGTTTTSSSSSASGGTTSTTTTSSGGGPCDTTPNGDLDGDGFTPNQGDCNDCDPEVGPNAIEIQGNALDENCDGALNDKLPTCDDLVAIDNPLSGEVARAVELCKQSTGEKDWGVLGSIWAMPDGSGTLPAGKEAAFHLGHGVLPNFGPNVQPRGGKRLLALSSGTARRPADPGYQGPQGFDKGYGNAPAPGFPKESPECNMASGAPHDATAIAVSVRVPANVHGFSYDFSFYAFDYPAYVCSTFNDVFFGILSPALAGQPDANVAYDDLGHPVSLNGANFRVCSCANGPPCTAGGKRYDCPLGAAQLLGTGFDGGGNGENRGATGWLTTTVPVDPGSAISIRWGIYDAGDGNFESTVLIDNWQWITAKDVVLGTTIAQ